MTKTKEMKDSKETETDGATGLERELYAAIEAAAKAHSGFAGTVVTVDTFYWSPDYEGSLCPVKGIITRRGERPPVAGDRGKRCYYKLVATTPVVARDRDKVWQVAPIGSVIWIDERHQLQALRGSTPLQTEGEYVFTEVSICPTKHVQKGTKSIWEFEIRTRPYEAVSEEEESLLTVAMAHMG